METRINKEGGNMRPRNVIVSLAIWTDEKASVLGDAQIWKDMLWNYISGAVELTEKPKVTIVQDTPKSKKGR